MKCANCGNTNPNSLHDEGDTIYCSLCTHRTIKSTGEDDLIICPICHHPRDRKAAYCMWCNGPISGEYDSEEEKLANEYQETITDDNLRYRKFKNFDTKKYKRSKDNDEEDDDSYQNESLNYSDNVNSDAENIGIAIVALAGLGTFLFSVGKKVYKRIKNKKNKKNNNSKKADKNRTGKRYKD